MPNSTCLGYCEVKSLDKGANTEVTHQNLVRLHVFCGDSLYLGEVKAMITFQAVS